jgi:hypothetical protein
MNEQIDIPEQIKRWNWGAFLLTPFWCIRHRIWQGLLLFIPVLGLIIPFILGAKGNQKAWKKNNQEPIDDFLKRQKYWGFAGLVIWVVGYLSMFACLSYILNYSDGMKMGLEIANSNKRLTEYFGKPIKKSSFLNGTYNYFFNTKPATLSVAFDAVGTQNEGHVNFQWEKRDGDWVVTQMAFADAEGKTSQLVNSPTLESSFFTKTAYGKTSLENALNRMIQEKDGYVILLRSKENNDFIQTATEISDNGDIVFSVVYSDGYTKWNKQLYQSKNLIPKEEVIRNFSLYATGSDSHIGSTEWNKLTSIESEGANSASFLFGESL